MGKLVGRRNLIHLALAVVFFTGTAVAGQKGKPGGGGGGGTPPFGEPVIAFVNRTTSSQALMLLDKDNNSKELIAGNFYIVSPSWAPPAPPLGKDRLAFSSTLDGTWGLYVIDADGQNLTRLASIEGLLSTPSWSPDGSWIVLTDSHPDPAVNDKDLIVIDVACAESGSSSCEYHFATPGFRENAPTWAPAGDRLVAKALQYETSTIELVVYDFSVDGSGMPLLGEPQVLNTIPTLSTPDGEGNLPNPAWSKENDQWLAILSRDANFYGDLYLVDMTTGEAFNLTNCPQCDNFILPSWSPCNNRIVVSTRDPKNKPNRANSTLAFVDIQYLISGPQLQNVFYLPRLGSSDDYINPDWKRGACTPTN